MHERAANAPASAGGYVGRLLYRAPENRYRLYRRGDAVHPDRRKGLYGPDDEYMPEYPGLAD